MAEESKVELELNPIKIILKGLPKNLLDSSVFILWVSCTVIFILLYGVASCFSIFNVASFKVSDFLSVGVTSLSFTLALLSATMRIYTIDDLVSIYKTNNSDYRCEGGLFYRTFSAYILTSTVWLIITIFSIIDKVFEVSGDNCFGHLFRVTQVVFVFAGVFNLWGLIKTHIQDIIALVEGKLDQEDGL